MKGADSMLHHVRQDARDGSPPHPLVVLLHGMGADEHDLVPVADPLRTWAHVVLLRAPEPVSGYPGFQWYVMQALGQPDPVSWLRSLSRLIDSLTALSEDPTVDASRVILGGFSQGALMTASVLCRRPDLGLAGYLLLSGYLPDWVEVPALTGVPVFFGHGTRDPVLPYAWGTRMADRLEAAGAHVERHAYEMGHAVSPEEMADLARFVERLVGPSPSSPP
jgi:phospholipase/carboxylesterase